jgi:hypothetical protein
VSRSALIDALAQAPAANLAEVLRAADISADPDAGSDALARKLVRALWWRTHTPAGIATGSFDRVVKRTGRRLKVELPDGDVWDKLEALTAHVIPDAKLDQIEAKHTDRLHRAQWAAWAGVGAAGATAGSGVAARKLLQWTKPVKDVLPWIPKVGPILAGVRKGAQVVAKWSTPVGIGMALASANQALGPEFDRALPLVLGVGLLKRGMAAEAEVVEPEVPAETEVLDQTLSPAASEE